MKLYDIENLQNSRIFFDKKPPKFMAFIIYFTLLMLLFLILASSKVKKNYIVKANGQISDKEIAYVSSNVNGTIEEVNIKEGSFVRKGQVILTLTNGEENIQRKEYEKLLQDNKDKNNLLDKYRKSLDEKTNHLEDSGVEQEYYGKVEYYLQSLEAENKNLTFANQDIEKKQSKLNEKSSEKDELSYGLTKLEKNKNYYKDLVKYYENLSYDISDLENELSELKLSETPNDELIGSYEKKLKKMRAEQRESSTAQEKSSKAELEYEESKTKVEALEGELEGLEDELFQLKRQTEQSMNQSEQIYFQFINEIGSEIKNIEKSNAEIKMNISLLSKRDQNFEITSMKSGNLHYVKSIKEGVNVQVNQTLAEISPLNKDNYYVDAYINIADISKVKENQDVDVAIVGVNTYKHGTLKGKVSAIENGVITIQGQESNNSFYKADIEIENKILKKAGEEIEVLLSMPVEVRIVYNKETYLDYLLEKLSFKE